MFPSDVTKSVAVYHMPNTAPQEYPADPDETILGALLPMDRREHALEGGVYTNPFELYVEGSADVYVTDKLVIDDTTYFVKAIFTANFGGLAHKRLSISSQA
jgi:hypothetical protein